MYTNSIFEESWWLDAVAPGQWKELKVERDGELIARWPIVLHRNKIITPKYTQTIGIWLNPKYVRTLVDEEEVYLQLIDQVPSGMKAELVLAPENTFFLPFIWKGFGVAVEASYIIDDLTDMDAAYACLSKRMKRDIEKAEKEVTIKETDDIEQLIKMSKDTYRRQRREYVVKPDVLRRIYRTATEHDACFILEAKDANGKTHSMGLFVYDDRRCYYLVGASDALLNAKSCANTLLLWEGIKMAALHSKVFDFEGSMIQGIGTFFRRFGSKLTTHYVITKDGLFGELFQVLRPRIKRLLGHKR